MLDQSLTLEWGPQGTVVGIVRALLTTFRGHYYSGDWPKVLGS